MEVSVLAEKTSKKNRKRSLMKPFLIILVILMLLLLAANAFAGTTISGIGNALTGYVEKLAAETDIHMIFI